MTTLLQVLAWVNALGAIPLFLLTPAAAIGALGSAIVCGFMAGVLSRLERIASSVEVGTAPAKSSAARFPLQN